MLLPRKDAETVENAIGRRLVESLASGGVRPFHNTGPVRTTNPNGTGLFLVKPAMAGSGGEMLSRVDKVRSLRSVEVRAIAEPPAENRKRLGRVIPMVLSEQQALRESLLDLMAVMGPMLWFGHAALVWLKIV